MRRVDATPSQTAVPAPPADDRTAERPPSGDGLVAAEVLVEEISIDGMCGVY
jgi:mycofactocin precursor